MAEFRTPIDIANRALQHCGATRIDEVLGFNEQSKRAAEVGSCYGQLRRAELMRNVWIFAIRRAILRPIDDNTMLLAPTLWQNTITYFIGSIVVDSLGTAWEANTGNVGNNPGITPFWDQYCGPRTVSLFNPTLKPPQAYFAGELVYTTTGTTGGVKVYKSMQNSNADVPSTATQWVATATYNRNEVVSVGATAYMSLIDLNIGQPPATSPGVWTTTFVGGHGSVKWLQIGGTEFPNGVGLKTLNILYPIGTGPSSQSATRNAFMLPANYLRTASQDPKAGSVSFLGMPGYLTAEDWEYENEFIVSRRFEPIPFRFVADIVDVTRMTDMFCEGLGARIALEVVETLTQSSEKKKVINAIYKQFMGEARTLNGIEIGPIEPPLDDYITTRI